ACAHEGSHLSVLRCNAVDALHARQGRLESLLVFDALYGRRLGVKECGKPGVVESEVRIRSKEGIEVVSSREAAVGGVVVWIGEPPANVGVWERILHHSP